MLSFYENIRIFNICPLQINNNGNKSPTNTVSTRSPTNTVSSRSNISGASSPDEWKVVGAKEAKKDAIKKPLSFSEMAKRPGNPQPATVKRIPFPEKTIAQTNRPHCYFKVQVDNETPFRVVFELRPDMAPKMADNFVKLCKVRLKMLLHKCILFLTLNALCRGCRMGEVTKGPEYSEQRPTTTCLAETSRMTMGRADTPPTRRSTSWQSSAR